MKIKNLLVIFIILHIINSCYGEITIDIERSKEALATTKLAVKKVQEFISSGSPGKIFKKIGTVLGKLGPAFMAVSALISIGAMFGGKQEPNPVMKALEDGFNEVNRKLDVVSNEIKNLESVVELNNAKASYAEYVTIINSNYDNFLEYQKNRNIENAKYFESKYNQTYEMAHEHLYDAMIGQNDNYGFKMITIYKKFSKCNPVTLSKFCVAGIQLINKGLTIEGTIMGFRNYEDKLKSEQKIWEERLDALQSYCSEQINECEESWNDNVEKEFKSVYNSALNSNTDRFATEIAKRMNEIVPQRYWLAVAYKDTYGFDEHCYSSYIDHRKIWHQNGYCVTLFSKSKDDRELSTQEFDALKQAIDKKSAQVANIDNCRKVVFVTITEDRYKGEHAKVIWNHMKSAVNGGLLYIIAKNTNPGYSVTGGRLIAQNQGWRCRGNGYLLLHYP